MLPFVPTLAGVAATAGTSLAAIYRGVTSPRSQLIAASAYHGDRTRQSLALTFDDGPSESTPLVLELLAELQVPATFFVCGMNVGRLPHIARRVLAEGHEIGNHTFSHARLCPQLGCKLNFRSPRNIYDELANTQQILAAETGRTPKIFRPPYGLRWFGLAAAQRRLELQSILWTVIARDWELPAREIADRVLVGATPGGIICLHDGRDIRPNPDLSEMLAALRVVIPQLRERGFTFETVERLIATDSDGSKPRSHGDKAPLDRQQ